MMTFNYDEAVQQLLWLGHEGRSLKWDLNNIRAVLEQLGHPEMQFASVHIAGTNGKGSVAAIVASILRAAGYRVGLYTSPHLERMNERIVVEGRPVDGAEFAAAFNAVETPIESLLAEGRLPHHPSFFECLTAMAFRYFAQAKVEIAVLEVGLGGRLDATNVVTPEVAAITAIDFDHERYLGHSIEQIAGEKAGIIKPGVPVISAVSHPVAQQVVAERAHAVGATVIEVEEDYQATEIVARDLGRYEFVVSGPDGFRLPVAPSLRGAFQVRNTIVAVAIARQLAGQGWQIYHDEMTEGVSSAQWSGRMELVGRNPLVFLDGAHNPAGAREVARFWRDHLEDRRIHLVYGTVRDKAVEEVAEILFPPAASVIVTRPSTPRAASVDVLGELARELNPTVMVEANPTAAVAAALGRAAADDVVFVTGSLFLVGDCRHALVQCGPITIPAAAVRPSLG